ncbi:MAG: SIS domain-containing protein, partial [Desulfococcaceae bacterium]
MCGLAGIVPVRNGKTGDPNVDLSNFKETARIIKSRDLAACRDAGLDLELHYLGGAELLENAATATRSLKADAPFFTLFNDRNARESLAKVAARLGDFIALESAELAEQMGRLNPEEVDAMSRRLELLKDISWCLRSEIDENIGKVRDLLHRSEAPMGVFQIFRRVNAVLNSIDRLEVRGRDSAGISLMFLLDAGVFSDFQDTLEKANFMDAFRERTGGGVLVNRSISTRTSQSAEGADQVALTFVYKVAAEIGSLGDNVAFLRNEIKNDPLLQAAVNFPYRNFTVLSHTRWASVGAISEPNCHPVDNKAGGSFDGGIYHVCLNGDIDNYLALKERMEKAGQVIPPEVSTDTKVIPLLVEHHVREGADVAEAFRRAVNEFEGSHAIAMHTDLAPGRMFLAQRGSGQAIFVGLADSHYMAASEVYGFIEETDTYLKLDGERSAEGRDGQETRGQIVILDQESEGGLSGITSIHYDGTPVTLTDADRKRTAITSRDIDRQEFPHYFLKEISEAPVSVERTLQNRWRLMDGARDTYAITLDEATVPESLRTALTEDRIRRVFFVGQGTAGVAAQACADILDFYMDDPRLQIDSLKASELSGFKLHDSDTGMDDTLVVAISQSGTTTDTNRTVDMVRERGAHTLAIVNRRDSDITFKVDGVMYTSSGRDIEMSVASTKAFYSQIVAGAMLSLFLAHVRGRRDDAFVTGEVQQLLALPAYMRRVLAMRDRIEQSARRTAV